MKLYHHGAIAFINKLLCYVRCTVYTVQHTLCNVHGVQCTMCSVHCTTHTVQRTWCTVYNVQCTLYGVYNEWYTHNVYYTIYIIHAYTVCSPSR